MDTGLTQKPASRGPINRSNVGPLMAFVSICLHLALGFGLSQLKAPSAPAPTSKRIELTLNPAPPPPETVARDIQPPAPAPPSEEDPATDPNPGELNPEEALTSDLPPQGVTPTPPPPAPKEAPLLLKDPIHLPEAEEAPEDAPLLAEADIRSKKDGPQEEEQRGAGSLFNPELREVFPDDIRQTGSDEPGKDDAPEAQLLQAALTEKAALRASPTRDVIPDPNPRQANTQPSTAAKKREGEADQRPDKDTSQKAPGPKAPTPNTQAEAKTSKGDDAPPPSPEPQGEAKALTPQKDISHPPEPPSPRLILPKLDSLPPLQRVASPLRVAALSAPKPAPGAMPRREGTVGDIGYEGPSALELPEAKGVADQGLGEGATNQRGGAPSKGESSTQGDAQAQQDRGAPLATQGERADTIKDKPNTKAPDEDGNNEPTEAVNPEVPREGGVRDPARRAVLMDTPQRAQLPSLSAQGHSQYDRVAMLQGLKAETPSGEEGEEEKVATSKAAAPPPGGGSPWPRPEDGVGGTTHEDRGAVPLSPEAVRRLSDQSGKAIAALDPGQFLDLSAKESPYWSYFSDAGRRFQRAWEKTINANPYFNVENDSATVRVAVVLNRRGKVEAVTYLERSYTDLDAMVTGLVEDTRLGRFPRGYPDTLVIQLRVDTTGR